MENKNTQQNMGENIERKVFERINSGDVKMHSKGYFLLKVAILVIVALLVLTTSAVLVSFMMFSLRVSGRLFLLGFGARGLLTFFITFPWFILLADVLFIVLFERLLNHFKFGYRNPVLYTLGASVIIIIAGGYILDHVSLHEALIQEVQSHHLGPMGGVYTGVRLPPRQEGVIRGIVISTSTVANTTSFVMRRDDEDQDTDTATDTAMIWHVILPQGVSIAGFLTPGDVVLVAGDILAANGVAGDVLAASGTMNSDTIRAYGIRKIAVGDEQ